MASKGGDSRVTKVHALANQKGGVGKTHTTYHLARACVEAGEKVLIIDTDPQGNMTKTMFPQLPENSAGLNDAISAASPSITLSDVIVDGLWDSLFVVPAPGQALAQLETELTMRQFAQHTAYRQALEEHAMGKFDRVLFDCPPALGRISINAFCASTSVILVTTPTEYGLQGTAAFFETLSLIQTNMPDIAPGFAGMVVTALENTNEHRSRLDELAAWGVRMLGSPVPKRNQITTSVAGRVGLDEIGSAAADSLAEFYRMIYRDLKESENGS